MDKQMSGEVEDRENRSKQTSGDPRIYFLGAASMETLNVYYVIRIPESDVERLFPTRVLLAGCQNEGEVLYFEPVANFAGRVKLIHNGSVSSQVKALLDQATPATYVVLTRSISPNRLKVSRLKHFEAAALKRSIFKSGRKEPS